MIAAIGAVRVYTKRGAGAKTPALRVVSDKQAA